MITWLHQILEKHKKWLFSAMLLVIVIPFVFTVGNMPGIGSKKDKKKKVLFLGYDLSDHKVVKDLVEEARLSHSLKYGEEKEVNFYFLQAYLFNRITLLDIAENLQLPDPSDMNLQKFIRQCAMLKEDGKFSVKKYNKFVADLKDNGKSSVLKRVACDDWKIQQVEKWLKEPPYYLKGENEFWFKRLNIQYKLQLVEKTFESFNPKIDIDQALVKKFFEERSSSYKLPEMAEASILLFDKNNYRKNISSVSEKVLKNYFEDNRELFADKEKSVNFEDVIEEVRKIYIEEQLYAMSEKFANNFAFEVYDKEIKKGSSEWKNLLKDFGVKIAKVKPFSRQDRPNIKSLEDYDWSNVFDLDEDKFTTEPIKGDSGYVIIALNKIVESRIPKLAEVKDKVEKDWLKSERESLFLKEGESIKDKISASKLSLKDFAEKNNLKFTELKPLKTNELVREVYPIAGFYAISSVMNELPKMNEGGISPPIRSDDGLVFLKLVEKTMPKLDEETFKSQEWKEFVKENKEFWPRTRLDNLLNEFVEKNLSSTDDKK